MFFWGWLGGGVVAEFCYFFAVADNYYKFAGFYDSVGLIEMIVFILAFFIYYGNHRYFEMFPWCTVIQGLTDKWRTLENLYLFKSYPSRIPEHFIKKGHHIRSYHL